MPYKDIAKEHKVSMATVSRLAKKSYVQEDFEAKLCEKEDKISSYKDAFIDIVNIFKLEDKKIESSLTVAKLAS